jgi:hypothetical protein
MQTAWTARIAFGHDRQHATRSGPSVLPEAAIQKSRSLLTPTQGECLALPDQELSGVLYMLAEWQSIETANGPALQASKCVRLA